VSSHKSLEDALLGVGNGTKRLAFAVAMVDGLGVEEGELKPIADGVLVIRVNCVDGWPAMGVHNGMKNTIPHSGRDLLFFEKAK
jgi:hypothetical protein